MHALPHAFWSMHWEVSMKSGLEGRNNNVAAGGVWEFDLSQ